jgi:ABC-type sugar transport system, permease component
MVGSIASKHRHPMAGRRAEAAIIYLILSLAALACLLPILYELSLSLSSNTAVLSQKVGLLPVEPTLNSYQQILKDGTVAKALEFSGILTVLFTLIAMLLTTALAYPLTRPELKGRSFFMTMIVITMYFSGGVLPLYILVKSLGMLNTIWSLILPLAISPFNVIIMRTSIASVPESLTESALIDGASYFTILRKIILPLSLPIVATLSLFYAVGRWNTFSDALYYITKTQMYTIQLKLSQIILNNTQPEIFMQEGASALSVVPASLTAATVMVATLPILCVYPWLQRYFIKGVMVGSVKE